MSDAPRRDWQPGDPLPTDTLWDQRMVAQYIRARSVRTVQRSGCPQVPGLKGRYDPVTVRAFFTCRTQGL